MDSLTGASLPPDTGKRTWRNAAFIVEALVLLVFIMIASAILLQLFTSSYVHGIDAGRLSHAVLLAENDAEAFAADPKSGDTSAAYEYARGLVEPVDDASDSADVLTVTRTVDEEKKDGGVLYTARIVVTCQDETVYEIETARYVSSGGAL